MALNPNSELWNYFDNIVEEGMAECKTCKKRMRNNRSFNLKQHIRKVHNSNNEIWKYFDNDYGEGVAVCKTCKQRLKNRTCNLRIHMRKTHNIFVKAPEDGVVQSPSSPQPYDEDQINAVLKAAKRKMNEGRFSRDKRTKRRLYIEMEKKVIIRAVMGLIIDDGVAPHLFSSQNMESLLRPMCEAIADQEGKEFKVDGIECERILNLIANHIRINFSNDLHWRLLSLKIDTDVDAPLNTFCVSALFVNEGHVQTHLLGIIDLKDDNQLSENHIKEILHKFNIDSNQIVAACWDKSKARFNQEVKNSDYLREIEQFQTYPEISLGDVKIEPYIGVIAQFCLLDIFKNSNIFQVFLECRNLVKFLNDESNGYYEIFEEHNLKMPQLDSPWRWGSTYAMINDLKEVRSFLEKVKFEKPDCSEDQFNANDKLLSFIDSFCKALSLIQKSIMKYYNEELHFGDFYAQWLKCKLLTAKQVTANNKKMDHLTLISSELLKSIENRSRELLSQQKFEACLYLDPRFQHTLDLQQKANSLDYLKKLWSRAKLYNADIVDPALSSVEQTLPSQQLVDDEDAFLNEFLGKDAQMKDTRTADVYKKIESLKLPFQMVDTNVLMFWKGQKFSEPEIQALSAICFAIPATQDYNKKLYSDIYALNANLKLSTFTKENLLITRLNAHLLEDAIEKLELFKGDKLFPKFYSETEHSEENESAAVSPSEAASSVVLATKNAVVQPKPTASVKPIIAVCPTQPMAVITPAGTAYLPRHITIKSVAKNEK